MCQISREDELKEELRREIRREWYQQRRRDFRMRQQHEKEQRRGFEERYQRVLSRQDDDSYTHTHKLFARTSPPRRDPPSDVAAQLMHSRSLSLLEDEEEEELQSELRHATSAPAGAFCASAGSDGTMEDVSVSS